MQSAKRRNKLDCCARVHLHCTLTGGVLCIYAIHLQAHSPCKCKWHKRYLDEMMLGRRPWSTVSATCRLSASTCSANNV